MSKYLLLIFFSIFNFAIHAQTVSNIFISSNGGFKNMQSSGLPVQFKSTASCLSVQNGVAVLYGERGNGEFAFNCEVSLKFNTLGIKLFPNPVISNNSTKVKFINTPPLTETFNLSIWSTNGLFIISKKETGYNIFQGINLDLGNIIAGSYVLKIESSNYFDAVKFIKSN
jgi:hypothetical protein